MTLTSSCTVGNSGLTTGFYVELRGYGIWDARDTRTRPAVFVPIFSYNKQFQALSLGPLSQRYDSQLPYLTRTPKDYYKRWLVNRPH